MPAVAHLVLTHGTGLLPLSPGENAVGRDAGCDVLLLDLSVSRRHATLAVAVAEYTATVRDVGSRNGTFVAGNRVTLAELEPGVEVVFGGVHCTYQRVDEALICGSTVK